MTEHRFTNALVDETSPYLLQHAHNPVQWHPWGQTALEKATQEDKPILLSIGYSACHWCHVMERESFENEEIAGIMNENFINIKVDREERPDLDTIYMSAVQMMTGHGGWPMTVFLTPRGVPFYGGTYFPPEDRHGMPGFPRLLVSVAKAYREKKADIQASGQAIVGEIERASQLGLTEQSLREGILDEAASKILSHYDTVHGGFGGAPKFPPSMTLEFLLCTNRRAPSETLMEAVTCTLTRMAEGGIYDQLGGGFHRYSVDTYWLVPHFEKMLYDNALLSRIYLHTFLVTGDSLYRRIAEETLDYVAREMTSPEGGFYSSQDADSEGHEGKFFVWTRKEVEAILGESDTGPFCHYFDISPEGNFEGKNILHVPRPANLVAKLCRMEENRLMEIVSRGKRLLLAVRDRRVRPGRDEKILTAWNGLMLRSFAEAANALDRADYRGVAVRNAEFLLSRMMRDGRVLRTCRNDEAKLNGYLEDYANLMDGLLALYEATFDPRWIREAESLGHALDEKFWDPEGIGFFFTAVDHESLITRPKEFYDNATPSGNSVAAHAMLRLSALTGNSKWSDQAESILKRMVLPISRVPSAFGHLLCALHLALSKKQEVAVRGEPENSATRLLLREVFRRYLPETVVACGTGDAPALLRDRSQINEKSTAFVCENHACQNPVTSPEELGRLLDN